MKKNVLIISYSYPPNNVAGAQRPYALAKYLDKEKYNVTFCYHNHGFEFEPYGEGTLFDYLVQNTDPKFVSYEMDILWTFFPGQNPATLLEKYR